MTFKELLSQPLKVIYRHTVVICMVVLIIPVATFYPIDIKNDYSVSKGGHERPAIVAFEDYGRHMVQSDYSMMLKSWARGWVKGPIRPPANIICHRGIQRLRGLALIL